ncbi:MAG: hypothetical protein HYZ60_02770 [Methylocystis sp.]|nr:hypothetical protein [Methylocystis sp.]
MTTAPLRILQIYPKDDYFTGAAIQLRELTQGLKGRGHEVVVATRPSAAWASKLREAGIVDFEEGPGRTRAPRLTARRVTLELDLVGPGSLVSVERPR